MLEMVFTRFEKDLGEDKYILKATMCLLEASRSGLCELEILQLLADDTLKGPGMLTCSLVFKI